MDLAVDPRGLPPIVDLRMAFLALVETLDFNGFLDLEVKTAVVALGGLLFVQHPLRVDDRAIGGRVLATREECIVQWRRIAAGVRARPGVRVRVRAPHDVLVEALSGYFVCVLRTQVEA